MEIKTTQEIVEEKDNYMDARDDYSDWTEKDDKMVTKKWVAVDGVKKAIEKHSRVGADLIEKKELLKELED